MREAVTYRLLRFFPVKLFKYGLIGGIATLIHIGVASLYLYMVGDSLFLSNVAGFLVAYVFSYIMQSLFVFEHAISWRKAARYFVVQFGSLLTAIMISNMFYMLNSYLKTFLVVVFMPFVTFLIHKFWTFKGEK